jgi:hypothetical protein
MLLDLEEPALPMAEPVFFLRRKRSEDERDITKGISA